MAACLALPSGVAALGAQEPVAMSDAEEIALGRRFAAEFEREAPMVTIPAVDRYLNSVAQQLARESERPKLAYRVKLIHTREVNASSLPGGTIYLDTGMLAVLNGEDELAAALAHEIAHIASRHAVRQLMLSLQAQAALEPLLENLSRQNGAVEKIIVQLGGAVALLARLSFSRQDEAEADRLGFYDVCRAGWDPRGFLTLFAALDAAEASTVKVGQTGGSPAGLFSGHPPTAERIAAMEREIARITIPEDARTDSVEFRACKVALSQLSELE